MNIHTFRIGYLSTFYHTSHLLKGTDILSRNGITAQWELFMSGPDIIRAMDEGSIDIAYIGLPPVIIGIDRNMPITCIAGGHIEGTIMIAGSDIKPLSSCSDVLSFLIQFEGGNIGSPPRGSIHDIIIRDLLERYELNSIAVVNYPAADFLPDALENGEIRAAVGTPALAVAGRWYGKARIVIQPEEIWPYNPSYGIITTRALLSNPEPLLAFLDTHEQANEIIRHHYKECAKIIAMSAGFVEEAYVLEIFPISPHYCSALPDEYIRSTMKFAHTLFRLKITSREICEQEIFHRDLITRVHPMPHHYRDGLMS